MPGFEGIEADRGSEAIPFETDLLLPHEIVPVRELKPFFPILTWKDAENRTLYDFGQNLAGFVALHRQRRNRCESEHRTFGDHRSRQ